MTEPTPTPVPDAQKSGSVQAAEAAAAQAAKATGAAVTHGADSFFTHNPYLVIGIVAVLVAIAVYFIF